MPIRKECLIVIAALCALAISGPALAVEASTSVSAGDYTAGTSAAVHWTIDPSHTLTWAGRPYVPVGGLFEPRCMAGPNADTKANWTADLTDLATLKAHGVTNVLLAAGNADSGSLPITAIPAATLQRVIDTLDQNGFTYGVDLNAYPGTSLEAVVVNPAIYRQTDPDPDSTATFAAIPGLKSALYVCASTHDGSILSQGQAQIQNGTDALVPVGDFGGDDTVTLVYPTRDFDNSSIEGRHCPDFWSEADAVRDDLILYLSQIKFGAGLRMFVDPMRDDLAFDGATNDGFAPTSAAYQSQFAAWLSTRYSGRLSVLQRAWGLKNEDLPDFDTASRAIPLWYQLKGIQCLYDPKTAKTFDVDTSQSVTWQDIKEFQESSMQSAMNGIAVALKSGVADVPIVYRWSEAGASTLNLADTGFDGILVDSPLHGNDLASQALGFALSDVEHARRTQWLMAEVTPPGSSGVVTGDPRTPIGYVSQELLTSDIELMTGLGVRGVYVDALRSNSPSAVDLLGVPSEQLDWLHQASSHLSSEASSLDGQTPSILYYPSTAALTSAEIQRLPSGAWWLPYAFASESLPLGSEAEGYSINENGQTDYVIYSKSSTPQQLSFKFQLNTTSGKPVVRDAAGVAVRDTWKKGDLTVTVSQDPIIISGVTALPVPDGAVADELVEVQRLLALGRKAGAPVVTFEQDLFHIQNDPLLEEDAASTFDYNELSMLAQGLKTFVSPFIWIEAEDAVSQSFGSVIASPDASGGAYLWLDRSASLPSGAKYRAQYKFLANAPGDYDVWASLAPAGSETDGDFVGSPLTVRIDDGTDLSADSMAFDGHSYGSLARSGSPVVGQFAWYRLTTVHISPGDHTLTLTVSGVSRQTGRWTLGIDAICLSRGDFRPNGTAKPDF